MLHACGIIWLNVRIPDACMHERIPEACMHACAQTRAALDQSYGISQADVVTWFKNRTGLSKKRRGDQRGSDHQSGISHQSQRGGGHQGSGQQEGVHQSGSLAHLWQPISQQSIDALLGPTASTSVMMTEEQGIELARLVDAQSRKRRGGQQSITGCDDGNGGGGSLAYSAAAGGMQQHDPGFNSSSYASYLMQQPQQGGVASLGPSEISGLLLLQRQGSGAAMMQQQGSGAMLQQQGSGAPLGPATSISLMQMLQGGNLLDPVAAGSRGLVSQQDRAPGPAASGGGGFMQQQQDRAPGPAAGGGGGLMQLQGLGGLDRAISGSGLMQLLLGEYYRDHSRSVNASLNRAASPAFGGTLMSPFSAGPLPFSTQAAALASTASNLPIAPTGTLFLSAEATAASVLPIAPAETFLSAGVTSACVLPIAPTGTLLSAGVTSASVLPIAPTGTLLSAGVTSASILPIAPTGTMLRLMSAGQHLGWSAGSPGLTVPSHQHAVLGADTAAGVQTSGQHYNQNAGSPGGLTDVLSGVPLVRQPPAPSSLSSDGGPQFLGLPPLVQPPMAPPSSHSEPRRGGGMPPLARPRQRHNARARSHQRNRAALPSGYNGDDDNPAPASRCVPEGPSAPDGVRAFLPAPIQRGADDAAGETAPPNESTLVVPATSGLLSAAENQSGASLPQGAAAAEASLAPTGTAVTGLAAEPAPHEAQDADFGRPPSLAPIASDEFMKFLQGLVSTE